jgi:hypothetical protein
MVIPLQCFHYPFPSNWFNTGTITVTLQISLYYSTHKVFKSHTKSSLHTLIIKSELTCTQQSQCLNTISLLPISYPGRLAPRARLTQTTFRVSYNHSARTTAENTASARNYKNTCLHHFYCMTYHARVNCTRSIATVRARTTKNTALVLLAACVFQTLPSNGSTCDNIHAQPIYVTLFFLEIYIMQNIFNENFRIQCYLHVILLKMHVRSADF